jgi:hypothetical protein
MVDKSLDHPIDTKLDKSLDNNVDITDEMRDRIRMAVQTTGPLSIPKDLLDPNYYYSQPLHDTEHPLGSYSRACRLGFQHVTEEMMPDLFAMKSAISGGFGLGSDGGRICHKVTNTQTHYLMRIPMAIQKEIEKVQRELNKEPLDLLMGGQDQQLAHGVSMSAKMERDK